MVLSASKIKTLNTCSWTYHTSYVLKLPRTSNTGSNLGTITHEILECLQNKRHRKHYNQLISEKTCKNNDLQRASSSNLTMFANDIRVGCRLPSITEYIKLEH